MGERATHPEVLHEVACGAHHARWIRVGDLDVEHPFPLLRLQQLLHQPGLANAAPARDLQKEPTPAAEHLGQLRSLAPPAVEAPLGHRAHNLIVLKLAIQLSSGLGSGGITG